jgi:hypothetical protein
MDKSVDIFAKAVRADPKLAKGFNAFGLSQGNNLIHGYQLKYVESILLCSFRWKLCLALGLVE